MKDTHTSTSSSSPCLLLQDECMSVLRSRYGCTLFRMFLGTLHTRESIDFWIAIEVYQAMCMRGMEEERALAASSIFYKYCRASSSNAVNIPDNMRRALHQRLQDSDIDITLFDDAQRHVYAQLSLDSFSRFKMSEQYIAYQAHVKRTLLTKALDHVKKDKKALLHHSTISKSSENLLIYTQNIKQEKKTNRRSFVARSSSSPSSSSSSSSSPSSSFFSSSLSKRSTIAGFRKSIIVGQDDM